MRPLCDPTAVLEIIAQHRGKANAIKGAEIALALGVHGPHGYKRVCDTVRDLRRAGYAIGGSQQGYYLATDYELREYYAQRKQRVLGELAEVRALEARHPELRQLVLILPPSVEAMPVGQKRGRDVAGPHGDAALAVGGPALADRDGDRPYQTDKGVRTRPRPAA